MKNLLTKKCSDWTLVDALKIYGVFGILVIAIWKIYELISENYTYTIKMTVKEELNNTKK